MKQTFKQIMGSTYYFADDQSDIPKNIFDKIKEYSSFDPLKEKFIATCFIDQIGSRGEFFVLVTEDRVIIKKAVSFQQNYFKDVTGVERTGALGDILLLSAGNKSDCFPAMNMPKKELIDKLFNIICTRWMQFQNIPSDSTDNIASQIEKLASLKERGILTEEEFTQKKKQLLGI